MRKLNAVEHGKKSTNQSIYNSFIFHWPKYIMRYTASSRYYTERKFFFVEEKKKRKKKLKKKNNADNQTLPHQQQRMWAFLI